MTDQHLTPSRAPLTATTTRAGDMVKQCDLIGMAVYSGKTSDAYRLLDELRAALATAPEQAGEPVAQWQPIATAPRDGTNILIRFGRDGVSQAKYVPGTPHPWKFIDTNDGITWLVNHAVDSEYGPTHWMPLPDLHTAPPPASTNRLTDEQILAIAWKYHYDEPDASGYDFGTPSLLEFARAIIAATEAK